jgi:hypothetical protein
MDSDLNAAAGGGDDITVVAPAKDRNFSSVSDAARTLANIRHSRGRPREDAAQDTPARLSTPDAPAELPSLSGTDRAPDERAEPAQDQAPEADAAPREEVRGETQGDDPDKRPPIEPPRSWTKDDKELFRSLPRETQERIAERERLRESDFLRRQNDAAEKLKALAAQEQAAAQAKHQYESALPTLLQNLLQQQAGEFSDIKSIHDIERLAREDWPRYVLWDAQQKKISALQQELGAALARQKQENSQRWSNFAQEQDALFFEKASELADKAQAAKIADSAVSVLKDIGFNDQELADLWNGRRHVSLRDHRLQLLIRDGVRYREAQAAAKAAAAKTVPQVQRPGAALPRNAEADARISALNNKLEQTGSLKDAAALLMAQRQARARR